MVGRRGVPDVVRAPDADAPLSYEAFRTGLTYRDVYLMVYARRWKRRRGVLGYWREVKRRMYAEYLERWEPSTAPAYVPSDDPIPD